jgi:hypothetical protein
MIDTVEHRWRALLAHGEPESREVDAESPLRMLIGVSPVGRPYFAIIVTQKPGLPDLTNAITVTRRQRASDGRWTLTLELQVHALTDAFISLVSDLASKSSAASGERAALEVFLHTLTEWQELLTARADHLSEGELRGLIAELWFGFDAHAHGHSAPEAAHAWTGPMGGAQDFQFPAPGHHFEVKSLRPRSTTIEISSAEQLDGHNIKLAVVTLEEVAAPSESVTLSVLVASVRSRLTEGADRSEFNRRFARLLVDPDDPWYAEQTYAVRRLRIFDVSEDFPALRRSQVAQAINQITYRIDVLHLSQFGVLDLNYPDGSGIRDG